jgi:hypothetical protein
VGERQRREGGGKERSEYVHSDLSNNLRSPYASVNANYCLILIGLRILARRGGGIADKGFMEMALVGKPGLVADVGDIIPGAQARFGIRCAPY